MLVNIKVHGVLYQKKIILKLCTHLLFHLACYISSTDRLELTYNISAVCLYTTLTAAMRHI